MKSWGFSLGRVGGAGGQRDPLAAFRCWLGTFSASVGAGRILLDRFAPSVSSGAETPDFCLSGSSMQPTQKRPEPQHIVYSTQAAYVGDPTSGQVWAAELF